MDYGRGTSMTKDAEVVLNEFQESMQRAKIIKKSLRRGRKISEKKA